MGSRLYRAILFDFDGVLAATMEDHFRAWQKALGDYGVKLGANEYFPLEGIELRELARKYCEEKGIGPAHAAEILKKKEEYYLAKHQFRFYPGVKEFIRVLSSKGVLRAIVTTGLRQRVFESAPKDFLDQFPVVVTGDDVARGKPFPDSYLKGAELLGVPAPQCIVVENSPTGINAGKTAGAYCIGIPSTLPRGALRDADVIIDSFKDLPQTPVIKELLRPFS
jgi:beta-phosphoglucomutase